MYGIKNGINATFPEKWRQNWFYALKVSLLNFINKDLYFKNSNIIDFRNLYFIIYGYNRMGYFSESIKIIDLATKNITINEKDISFKNVIDSCYLLSSISDYFIHVRDTDYLQSKYSLIRSIANYLYKYSKNKKKTGIRDKNSIRDYYIKEEHHYDNILLTFSLEEYSYLARCIGIFGDEIKFKKESERLSTLFFKELFDSKADEEENEFIFYNIYAGFPFRLNNIKDDNIKVVLNKIKKHYNKMPIFLKSIGWDIISTLVTVNNMIYLKDNKSIEIIDKLLKKAGNRYVLPDYMNPATGKANWGRGESRIVSSMIFSVLRNMLFIDYPERLDIFPVSRPEWFKPGNKIVIDDAPSRFGPISISVLSTSNEVQFHFEKLPKFVPADIMINLPFKIKIKPEDDFIVKKEFDNAFIINGWPSIVRFVRK